MSALPKPVGQAADLIERTVRQHGVDPARLTEALASAQLLQSPETAAEQEHLRKQCESYRLQLNELGSEYEQTVARVAELLAEKSAQHDDLAGAVGYSVGTEWSDLIDTVAANTVEVTRLQQRVAELEAQASVKDRPVDEDPITYALTPKARRSSDRLREILAEQRAQVAAEGGAS